MNLKVPLMVSLLAGLAMTAGAMGRQPDKDDKTEFDATAVKDQSVDYQLTTPDEGKGDALPSTPADAEKDAVKGMDTNEPGMNLTDDMTAEEKAASRK